MRHIDKLYENKHLSANESDNAKLQYEEFLKDIATRHQEKFVEFDMNKDRLDHFFQMFINDQYKDMLKAIKMVFIIPNGQAQVERGFSINKEMVIENLHAQSLCALRLVYDSIKATKKEVDEIEISKKMLISCKSAHSKYKFALEKNQKAKNDTEKERKRKMISDEIASVKKRRIEIQSCIALLNEDAESCCKEGEAKHDISFFLKANALKKTIKEKEELVQSLDDAIVKLEKDKKKLA